MTTLISSTSAAPVRSAAVSGAPTEAPAPTAPPTKAEAAVIAKDRAQFTEFLVLLDDQGTRDTEKAFTMPVGDARREFVAKKLIANMVKTQTPLWKVLDGLQDSGHVSPMRGYKPLWIQNAIVVYGDETARTTMSSAAGVAQSIESATHVLDLPGEHVDQLGSISDAITGASDALADLPFDVAAKPRKVNLNKDPYWNLERVGVDKAAADGLTGKGIKVGVLDTGLDVEHPFLLGNYAGYDASTGQRSDTGSWYDADEANSPSPVDDGRHGTFVGGQIVGHYGGVQTGVAPDAELVAARGLGAHGGTDGMLLSAFQNMIAPRFPTPGVNPGTKRDVTAGPDIINNSWGSDDGNSISYQHALRNMDAMGIVNVFAAGNDGASGRGTVGSPGSNSHIITVAATDRKDKVASFSSRGPSPLPVEDGEPVPFIAAPGVDIKSTIPGGGIESGWQGTSMATPMITGILALADQAAVEETGYKFDTRAMKEVLKRAAQDVSLKGVDDNTGYGIPVLDDIRSIVREVAVDLQLAGAPT